MLSSALARLSVSRFIQQIFAIKSRSRRKTEHMQNFLAPIFFGGTTPTLLRQIVIAIYPPPFCKVWLSSVCLSPSEKPANEVESRIRVGWVKMQLEFEAVCGPKLMF